MYLITEISDREHASAHAEADRAGAVAKANELLKAHCALGGNTGKFEKEASGRRPDAWPQDMSLAGDGDSQDPSGAWCNLKSGCTQHWDAHVTAVGPALRKSMLDILLKELCRDAMHAASSSCGDGSCDECCISQCLELMQDTWPDSHDGKDGKNDKDDD